MKTFYDDYVDVSVIIPIYNGEKWIDRCFNSILSQTAIQKHLQIEISIFNDASVDKTEELLLKWKDVFLKNGCRFIAQNSTNLQPQGVGYAKNEAVKASHGEYLCFQDVDDEMRPNRIWKQYLAAYKKFNTIVGCKFRRYPPGSTERYTKWANNLTQKQLNTQIYTSHGPTVIMPTWFCHRNVFKNVEGFSDGRGIPEDLIFFYKHIDKGGEVLRVDDYLLIYSYHQEATTFSISSEYIWNLRFSQLQKDFLPKCTNGFTIWNAGKQGRKFVKCLNEEQRSMIIAMCDVDKHKIGTFYEMFCPVRRCVICKIPIIHFSQAKPPVIICMKMDLTNGEFEKNLKSLNLKENTDYVLFC